MRQEDGIDTSRFDRADPPLPPRPTAALPGSEEKLRAFEERLRRGQSLFHPDDPREPRPHLGRGPRANLRLHQEYAMRRNDNHDPDPLMLTSHQVARRLSTCVRTVFRMVEAGEFPQPVRMSRKWVRWATADVEQWIREQIAQTRAQAAAKAARIVEARAQAVAS